MAPSSDLPADRQAIGQLLVRLLREFRTELAAPRSEHGYADVRDAHMQIFGNIHTGRVRLTDLASRAQLSLAATSELVNELESLGYLARRADPSDGRAKLIVLTDRGRHLMRDAGGRVAQIEAHWSSIVGDDRFRDACQVMQELLDELDPDTTRQSDDTGNQRPSKTVPSTGIEFNRSGDTS